MEEDNREDLFTKFGLEAPQYKPSDYEIRQMSFNYACELLKEFPASPKKLDAILEDAKTIENYFRTGKVKITYEKS